LHRKLKLEQIVLDSVPLSNCVLEIFFIIFLRCVSFLNMNVSQVAFILSGRNVSCRKKQDERDSPNTLLKITYLSLSFTS